MTHSAPMLTDLIAGDRERAAAWSTLLAELGLPSATDPHTLARRIQRQRHALADALATVREALKPFGAYHLRHQQALVRLQQILVDATGKEEPPA